MATIKDLATRALREIGVVGAADTPDANDQAVAEQKLMDVHAYLRSQKLLRWTTQDIPDYAELPYVLMGATLCSVPFGMSFPPGTWAVGLSALQSAVNVPAHGVVPMEAF